MDILKHTPIRIGHIAEIQNFLGINATDMAWLLGAFPGRWSAIVRDARLNPDRLADPCHALLLRWAIQHSTDTPSLYAPEAGVLLRRLRAVIGDLTAKRFAVTLGWDASAGSRWHLQGSPIGPAGRRALAFLDGPAKRLAANWRQWAANAEVEASLRGFDLSLSLGWCRFQS